MGLKKKSNSKSKASVAARRSSEELKSKAASKTAIETTDDPATSASEAFNEDDSTSAYRVQNLSPEDLENFEVVKRGDLEAIKELLESDDFKNNGDINRSDLSGFTMLHHAVVNQYERVVELLLQQDGIFVCDTLNYAILEGNIDIVKQLIVHTSDRPESVGDAPDRDSDFPDSLTPLMLACKQGSRELIELFYNDGERLTWCPENEDSMYHDRCACDMCNGTKGLEEDRKRLTLWQAFSNPVYISFITNQIKGFDPVQEAFYLIGILRDEVIPNEVIFTQEYSQLKENLEAFTVDLLNMCHSRYETELMLKAEKDNKETTEPFPRLQWAMRLRHSNFVTHQHAQSLVYKWWVGDGWPSWPGLHPVTKALHFLSRLILFIPVSILLLFDRESSLGKFFSTPLNIFLNSMAAYIVFLIVLIFQVLSPHQRCNTGDILKTEDECTEKGPPRVGTEFIILIFVLGFIVSTVKHIWPSKKGFFRQKWNVFNVVTQVLFLLVFTFWGLSYLEWTAELAETNGVVPDIPRHMWNSYDPILIAEALFGMATILSVAKLMQYLQVQEYYGPIQTGLGSIIHRALATGVVFLYVLLAFGAGISGNYNAYMDEENDKVQVGDSYSTLWGATHRFFYGLHWLYDHDALKIGLEPITDENGTVQENHHIVNEYVGQAMAVIFQIYAWILMMNMLVAFFFTTFGDIQDNLINTWKYVRTEVYFFYGAETALPSPFNLLTFLNFYYYSKCSKKSTTQAACNMNFCCHYKLRESKEEARNRKIRYLQLMKKFTMQYLDLAEERNTEELAEADDVKEIIEELDELKSLMKERGLSTPPAESKDELRDKRFDEYKKRKAGPSDSEAEVSTKEDEPSGAPGVVDPPSKTPSTAGPSKAPSVAGPSKTPSVAGPSKTPSSAVGPPLPPKTPSEASKVPPRPTGSASAPASPSPSKTTTIKPPAAPK